MDVSKNRIYHDWEFLEDGASITPISVGMITEAGDEYYAVNADMPWLRVCGHPWLRQHVVPHLPLAGTVGEGETPVLDLVSPAVKPLVQIRREVRGFILSHPDPELWGWYSDFDQVALAWLYGAMISLPPGFPMRTSDVQQEADRLGVKSEELPAQENGVHSAIDDVRHVRRLHRFLMDLERNQVQRRRELTHQLAASGDRREAVQLTRMLGVLCARLGGRVEISDADMEQVDGDGLVTYRASMLDQNAPVVLEYRPRGERT